MSTRSSSSNLFSPLKDPKSLIRQRNLGEPSSLFDFEEVMSNHNNVQGPPPAGAGPPPPFNNGPPPVIQKQRPSGSGSLPSDTIANSRGDLKAITTRSGVAYKGPSILPTSSSLPKEVEQELKVTKDKVQPTRSESTAHVHPPVVPILEPKVVSKPNPRPSIPYPSRLNKQNL
uniref:Reverse transcriptase domain-containing protein n=1 Tax=Tanacetum cinerariifolium TaxID=118510 RepID=A0A6L2K7I9_TANCI|nr:reverse transcriptase domain-containing protein [Tanacetum cinerariifolium]